MEIPEELGFAGGDPGILVRGGGAWIFFSKTWGLGAALRPSGGGPGGDSLPEAPEF